MARGEDDDGVWEEEGRTRRVNVDEWELGYMRHPSGMISRIELYEKTSLSAYEDQKT